MTSVFDMNTKSGLCNICMQLHPATNPCKFDVLVKQIHVLRTNMTSLMQANREAVDTARAFQQLIREFGPNAERWSFIELEYKKLVNGLKGAGVHPFAPSTDPNKPAPLVGVSVDTINELLPPDIDDTVAFEKWLVGRHQLTHTLPKEDHACSTGDCGHDKQAECDETLAKDYPECTTTK